jgi:hypothetical protein
VAPALGLAYQSATTSGFQSAGTLRLWNIALNPLWTASIVVNSLEFVAVTFLIPFVAVVGPIAPLLLGLVVQLAGNSPSSGPDAGKPAAFSGWDPMVTWANLTDQGLVADSPANASVKADVNGGILAFASMLVLQDTVLGALLAYRFSASVASIFVSGVLGTLALFLALILGGLQPGSLSFDAAEAGAGIAGLVSLVLDGFTAIVAAGVGSLLVVPAAVVLGEDFAALDLAYHGL